jgi:hypothetical protein
MKFLMLLGLILSGSLAQAIPAKDCPDKLTLTYSNPIIEKEWAQEQYAEFEAQYGAITAELEKSSADAGTCYYLTVNSKDSWVSGARIRGTFKSGSKNPPVLTAFMSLPVKKSAKGANLGEAVVYTPIKALQPDKVELVSETSSLYYQTTDCSYGDCTAKYIRLGTVTTTLSAK